MNCSNPSGDVTQGISDLLPMGISILDLSAYVGLVAVAAVTLNMVLGTMMAFRYSPVRSWPHRRFNYFRLHNWLGYIALAASLLHPALLLLNKKPAFRVRRWKIRLERWRFICSRS